MTETLLWVLSLFLVGSMVVSLFVFAIPGVQEATPTPEPTFTATPSPTFAPGPTQPPESPSSSPPIVGPELPAETPAPSATPSPAAELDETAPLSHSRLCMVGNGRSSPVVFGKILHLLVTVRNERISIRVVKV